MKGFIWENNQLLLKVGMITHYSKRYLFGKKSVCKCTYQKHMQSVGIRAGREGAHGWLDFLAVTIISSPICSLIDKREESWRKKLKYPIKAQQPKKSCGP